MILKDVVNSDDDNYNSWAAYALHQQRARRGGVAYSDRGAFVPDPDELALRAYAMRLLSNFYSGGAVVQVMWANVPTPAEFIDMHNLLGVLPTQRLINKNIRNNPMGVGSGRENLQATGNGCTKVENRKRPSERSSRRGPSRASGQVPG